jgi:hypothetical protein
LIPARCIAVVLPWLLGGCAVDLWVGDPAGTEGSEGTTSAASDGGTTIAPPSPDTGTSTTGPEPPSTTTDAGTTVALDEGTSSTGPIAEESTSTGIEAGSTTTVEIPCPGLGMLDCNELGYCLWYGTAEMGECAPSPCEDPRHDCWGLGLDDCGSLFACAWVAVPEPGECAPIECVPCEILGGDQCMETPTCMWNEGEMFCLPA